MSVTHVVLVTANLTSFPTAGCCHQASLMAQSYSHCPSILKLSWWLCTHFPVTLPANKH